MSFLSQLARTYGKRPVWLAEIARGSEAWRYRLGTPAYEFGGEAYAASPLSFEGITYSSEIRKDDFTLDGFPLSDPGTQALIGAAEVPTTLVLRRGFEGDPEVVIAYRGRLSAVKPGRRTYSLVWGSWSVDASRRGDGFVAQRQCPWRLYGPDCAAAQAAHEVAGMVTAYAGGVATVAAAAGLPDGTYAGGLLRLGADQRTIVRHVGPSLTLGGGFPALAAEVAAAGSAAVQIARGCDKSTATCASVFANIANFGGLPKMTDNPIERRVF